MMNHDNLSLIRSTGKILLVMSPFVTNFTLRMFQKEFQELEVPATMEQRKSTAKSHFLSL